MNMTPGKHQRHGVVIRQCSLPEGINTCIFIFMWFYCFQHFYVKDFFFLFIEIIWPSLTLAGMVYLPSKIKTDCAVLWQCAAKKQAFILKTLLMWTSSGRQVRPQSSLTRGRSYTLPPWLMSLCCSRHTAGKCSQDAGETDRNIILYLLPKTPWVSR